MTVMHGTPYTPYNIVSKLTRLIFHIPYPYPNPRSILSIPILSLTPHTRVQSSVRHHNLFSASPIPHLTFTCASHLTTPHLASSPPLPLSYVLCPCPACCDACGRGSRDLLCALESRMCAPPRCARAPRCERGSPRVLPLSARCCLTTTRRPSVRPDRRRRPPRPVLFWFVTCVVSCNLL